MEHIEAQQPGLRELGRAITGTWASFMSGGLTVPLTVLSFWVAPDWQKRLYGCLAVLTFVFTIYSVWAAERRERIKAEREAFKADGHIAKAEAQAAKAEVLAAKAEARAAFLEQKAKPQIQLRIERWITGKFYGSHAQSNARFMCILLVEARNLGAPTVVDDWIVDLVQEDSPPIRMLTMMMPNSVTMDMGPAEMVLSPENELSSKLLVSPLQTGAKVRGFLLVAPPDFMERTALENYTVRVTAKDAWENFVSTTFSKEFHEQKNEFSLPFMHDRPTLREKTFRSGSYRVELP